MTRSIAVPSKGCAKDQLIPQFSNFNQVNGRRTGEINQTSDGLVCEKYHNLSFFFLEVRFLGNMLMIRASYIRFTPCMCALGFKDEFETASELASSTEASDCLLPQMKLSRCYIAGTLDLHR